MGGYPGINLASHRRDDRHYDRKRRELRKHLPALKQYLGQMTDQGATGNIRFQFLREFEHQLTDPQVRVPMHVLLRGEDLMRRDVFKHTDIKGSIVEAVWRSQEFRMAVSKKLMETLQKCGHSLPANAAHFEENIFKRAKTKESYLELAARVILYLREQHTKAEINNRIQYLKETLTKRAAEKRSVTLAQGTVEQGGPSASKKLKTSETSTESPQESKSKKSIDFPLTKRSVGDRKSVV